MKEMIQYPACNSKVTALHKAVIALVMFLFALSPVAFAQSSPVYTTEGSGEPTASGETGETKPPETDKTIDYCEDCDCVLGQIIKSLRAMLAGETKDSAGACKPPEGMAYALFDPNTLGLRITDRPLGYTAPYGPGTRVILNYNSNDASALPTPNYTNLGPRWKLNFVQFVEVDDQQNEDFLNVGSGGRGKFSTATGASTTSYGKDKLVRMGASNYEHRLTDGTVEVYDVEDTEGVGANGRRRLFLHTITDVYGNGVTLNWVQTPDTTPAGPTPGLRLESITDATGKVTTLTYDDAAGFPNRLKKITDPYGRTVTMTYSDGKLWKLTDAVGIVSEFTYNGNFITALTTPYGTSQFERGPVLNNNVETGHYLNIIDAAGLNSRMELRYAVDAAEFGTEPLPPGKTSEMRSGRYTLYWPSTVEPAQRTIANAYAGQWASDGAATTRAIASFKAPLVNRVWANFTAPILPGEASSRLGASSTVQVQPDNSVLTASGSANDDGLPTSRSDGFGHTVSYEYHANTRNLHRVKHTYTPSGGGAATETTLVTVENYTHQRPGKVTAADGTITEMFYNTRGQLWRVKNALNEISEVAFDTTVNSPTFGRRISVSEAVGTALERATGFQYDAYSRLWKITDHEARVTTLEYDALGAAPNQAIGTLNRVVKVIHPDGKSERVEFDPAHPLDVQFSYDVEGKRTEYERNGNGEVTRVTTADGKVVEYLRSNCCGGAIDTLVDAAGNKTHWKHDILGRVTEKWLKWDPANPGGNGAVRVQLLTYDEVGRAVTKTDARGNVRTVTYDAQGRMNGINYTIAGTTKATPNVVVTYEPQFGRVATVTDATGTHTYSYVPFNAADAVYGDGGLATITKADADLIFSTTHSYSYDKLGRAKDTTMQSSLGIKTRSMTYDALGRLTHYITPLGDQETSYVGKTGRVDWTQIGALKTAYGYTPDPEKRFSGITQSWNNTAIETHSYGYDAVGRLTFWAKAWDGVTRTWTMGYDASEQLETVAETTGGVATNLHHYTYDAAGNRTSEQRGGGVKSWVANGFNQLTQQTVGGEMELRGNVSPKSTVKINNQPAEMREGGVVAASGTEWRKKEIAAAGQNTFSLKATEDAPPGFVPQVLNKTITVNIQPEPQISYQYDADGNMLTDGITSYEWDAENRLVAVTSSPMGRVEFVYDAFSRRVRIIEKAAGTFAVTADKKLVWEGTEIVQQYDAVTTTVKHYFGNGETHTAVGTNPPVTMEYLYTRDHLGSIRQMLEKNSGSRAALIDYSPYGVQTVHQASVASDFGYTGHYTNAKTGLVLAPYRAYDPVIARWISRDPIEEDGGINLYGYVGNGPLGAVDPLGLKINWDTTFKRTADVIKKMRGIDPVFDQQIKDLENSEMNWQFGSRFGIQEMNCKWTNLEALKKGKPTGGTINVPDPKGENPIVISDGIMTIEEIIAHEVMHAWRMDQGKWDFAQCPTNARIFNWTEEILAVRAQNRYGRAAKSGNVRKTYGGVSIPGYDQWP